jgi:hypothetical protein
VYNEKALDSAVDLRAVPTLADAQEAPELNEPQGKAESLAAGAQLLVKIRSQIDTASNYYIIYSSVVLMLGAPLHLFKPALWGVVRQLLLNVGQKLFVVLVVAGMWVYDYINGQFAAFDFELYWAALLTDPCFIQPDFVAGVADTVNEACNELNSVEPTTRLSRGTLMRWRARSSTTTAPTFSTKLRSASSRARSRRWPSRSSASATRRR